MLVHCLLDRKISSSYDAKYLKYFSQKIKKKNAYIKHLKMFTFNQG